MKRPLLGLLGAIALWGIAAFFVDTPIILPGPAETLARLAIMADAALFSSVVSSMGKVLAVLCIVVCLGVGLGMALGLSPALHEAFRPLLLAAQAMPVISWLALVVFAFGIGWRGPVFIASLAFLPSAVFTTVAGVRHFERDLVEMADLYGVRGVRRWRDLYLGSLAPFMKAVVDTVSGGAWKAVLVAEYLCGGDGLGVRIAWARQMADVEGVYALSLVAVLLGLLGEWGVRTAIRGAGRRGIPS